MSEFQRGVVAGTEVMDLYFRDEHGNPLTEMHSSSELDDIREGAQRDALLDEARSTEANGVADVQTARDELQGLYGDDLGHYLYLAREHTGKRYRERADLVKAAGAILAALEAMDRRDGLRTRLQAEEAARKAALKATRSAKARETIAARGRGAGVPR